MKKFLLFTALVLLFANSLFGQFPLKKSVKILFSADKQNCLQDDKMGFLTLAKYAEQSNQEWKILPTDEAGFYYMQTIAGNYLQFVYADEEHKDLNAFKFTSLAPSTETHDNYKFAIQPTVDGGWEISPKINESLFIQQENANTTILYGSVKQEFSVTSFLIDTVADRRPIPKMSVFEKSSCAAGLLKNFEPIELYGTEAAFYSPGGMYAAQFVLRLNLSADKKDRIEVIIYDDIRKFKKRTYLLTPKIPKPKAHIRLFENDKMVSNFNQASLNLEITSLASNSFILLIQDARNYEKTRTNSVDFFDIAIKGNYISQ